MKVTITIKCNLKGVTKSNIDGIWDELEEEIDSRLTDIFYLTDVETEKEREIELVPDASGARYISFDA